MTGITTKYATGDPRYDQEFETALDSYLTNLPLAQVLLDLRGASVTIGARAWQSPKHSPVPVLERSGIRQENTGHEPPGLISVFVSYFHGSDADARERFERENGTIVRSSSIYPGELSTGPEVRREIRRRVAGCDFVVVLVGRYTHARRWVDWEIHAALTCRTPKPLVAVLLPELAGLAELLSQRLAVVPGESAIEMLKSSDDVSRKLLAATGTTLPARLLDNLLSGYATLISWPASPRALRDVLDAAVGCSQPITRRRLMRENFPLPAGQPPEPDPVTEIPGPREPVSPKLAVSTREAPRPPRAWSAAVTTISPPSHLPAADLPAWLVRTLQAHGPAATLTALDAIPEYSGLAAALRRHSHLLEPLDSKTSMAALLLARLSQDRALTGIAPALNALLEGPYLEATSLPDLPQPGLIQVLGSGEGAISALAVAPDGRWLASLTSNGALRIWDIPAGAVRHVLTQPEETGAIGRPALLADTSGAWLAARTADGLIEVWDAHAGTRLCTFRIRYAGFAALAAPADGTWLAAIDGIGVAQVWSLPSGQRLNQFTTGIGLGGLLVADPRGRWLATAGGTTVRVWDAATGALLHELSPRAEPARLRSIRKDDGSSAPATARGTRPLLPCRRAPPRLPRPSP